VFEFDDELELEELEFVDELEFEEELEFDEFEEELEFELIHCELLTNTSFT
jgi:hypothetical protein